MMSINNGKLYVIIWKVECLIPMTRNPVSDFEFSGSMGSMYRQIGIAVAVLFAKKIGEEFYKLKNSIT